jgi:ribosomal protein L14E/L6E/L27E
MSAHHISIGQIVTSLAGRDTGHPYLVIGITGKYVFLADGRERSVIKPKKKNIRHVKAYKLNAEALAEKLRSNGNITNEEIRQAIAAFCKPDNL